VRHGWPACRGGARRSPAPLVRHPAALQRIAGPPAAARPGLRRHGALPRDRAVRGPHPAAARGGHPGPGIAEHRRRTHRQRGPVGPAARRPRGRGGRPAVPCGAAEGPRVPGLLRAGAQGRRNDRPAGRRLRHIEDYAAGRARETPGHGCSRSSSRHCWRALTGIVGLIALSFFLPLFSLLGGINAR
jgi:hypothetical protein